MYNKIKIKKIKNCWQENMFPWLFTYDREKLLFHKVFWGIWVGPQSGGEDGWNFCIVSVTKEPSNLTVMSLKTQLWWRMDPEFLLKKNGKIIHWVIEDGSRNNLPIWKYFVFTTLTLTELDFWHKVTSIHPWLPDGHYGYGIHNTYCTFSTYQCIHSRRQLTYVHFTSNLW